MKIRELVLSDFEAVNDIFMQLHDLHAENRPDVYRRIEKPTESGAWGFAASLGDEDKIVLGAEADGRIVGLIIITMRRPSCAALAPRSFAYIDELAVDEKYRRRGIGTLLFREGMRRAKASGADSVELKVWGFNEAALSFYKSLGMTVQNYTMEQPI